jgi:hypothetical protein
MNQTEPAAKAEESDRGSSSAENGSERRRMQILELKRPNERAMNLLPSNYPPIGARGKLRRNEALHEARVCFVVPTGAVEHDQRG